MMIMMMILLLLLIIIIIIPDYLIGDFAGSLRDRRTGLGPDPNGAGSLHVSGCTFQLELRCY